MALILAVINDVGKYDNTVVRNRDNYQIPTRQIYAGWSCSLGSPCNCDTWADYQPDDIDRTTEENNWKWVVEN